MAYVDKCQRSYGVQASPLNSICDKRTYADKRWVVGDPVDTAAGVRWGTPVARGVLLTTILGSGMAMLDGTIVNVALPRIGAELHASVSGLQWILDGYLLALAALILVAGSLGCATVPHLVGSSPAGAEESAAPPVAGVTTPTEIRNRLHSLLG